MDKTTAEHHIMTASRLLGEALHYYRFFGHPIAEFSDRHNEQRAAGNARLVSALAHQAGMYVAFAGQPAHDDAGLSEVARAALRVEAIENAYCEGFGEHLEIVQ